VLRILTELDRAALAAYCQAYGRWVEAERKLHETPMLLKLPSGYVQQNPWLCVRRSWSFHITSLPMSRSYRSQSIGVNRKRRRSISSRSFSAYCFTPLPAKR
jgi:P27 family predicted phage terminase small subunit